MKIRSLFALAAGFISFATNVKGAETVDYHWTYFNLANNISPGGNRITSTYMGWGQSFSASSSDSIATLAFSLFKLSSVTGSMDARLYNITNSSSFGSQVGSTINLDTSSIKDGYNGFDVSNLNWNLIGGQQYAVTLSGGSDFYNPDGGGNGMLWASGSGSGNNLVELLDWDVRNGNWENVTAYGWDGVGKGFSVGLSSQAVPTGAIPEPSSFALLGLGALGLVARRRR